MDLNFRINFKVKLNSEKFAKQWRNRTQRLDLVKSSFKLLALDLSTNQSDPSKATKTFGKNQNRKEQSPDFWFARDQLAAKSERGPICLESARIHPESIVFQYVEVWLRKMVFTLITALAAASPLLLSIGLTCFALRSLGGIIHSSYRLIFT